jgi:hypothetical protein
MSTNVTSPTEFVVGTGGRSTMAARVEPTDSLDFFPTPPWATRALIVHVLPALGVQPSDLANLTACDPACGEGHMAEPLGEYFGRVIASDIYNYGYGQVLDFLTESPKLNTDWCITNPPFAGKTLPFILQAFKTARVGVAMFVRLQWLETIGRYEALFRDCPPTVVSVFAERVPLCKARWNPDGDTATAYIWLTWVRGAQRRPLFWIPPGCRSRLSRPDDIERFTTHPVTRKHGGGGQ